MVRIKVGSVVSDVCCDWLDYDLLFYGAHYHPTDGTRLSPDEVSRDKGHTTFDVWFALANPSH